MADILPLEWHELDRDTWIEVAQVEDVKVITIYERNLPTVADQYRT